MKRYLIISLTCMAIALSVLWCGVARADTWNGFFVVDSAQWDDITTDTTDRINEILRDWVVVGSEAGKSVVYVLVDVTDTQKTRLKSKAGYLGESYTEIVAAAKAGPGLARTVVRKLFRTCWDAGATCGTFNEWVAAARPARSQGFSPPLCWLGHDCPMSEQGDME